MANGQDKRASPENLEDTKTDFNSGGNDSDFDGGHPADGAQGNVGKLHGKKPASDEKESQNQFNAGGNASDFDGGQPADGKQSSEGRIDTDR